MSARPLGSSVFFLGSRSFRSWRTIRGFLARVAVSAVAFALVAVGLARQPPLSGFILLILLLGGTAAVAFAASLLTAFAVAQIDHVVISNRRREVRRQVLGLGVSAGLSSEAHRPIRSDSPAHLDRRRHGAGASSPRGRTDHARTGTRADSTSRRILLGQTNST